VRSELERDYYSTAFAKMQALILKKSHFFFLLSVALRGKIVYTEGGNVPQEKRFLKC